jgi:hypothetical protein
MRKNFKLKNYLKTSKIADKQIYKKNSIIITVAWVIYFSIAIICPLIEKYYITVLPFNLKQLQHYNEYLFYLICFITVVESARFLLENNYSYLKVVIFDEILGENKTLNFIFIIIYILIYRASNQIFPFVKFDISENLQQVLNYINSIILTILVTINIIRGYDSSRELKDWKNSQFFLVYKYLQILRNLYCIIQDDFKNPDEILNKNTDLSFNQKAFILNQSTTTIKIDIIQKQIETFITNLEETKYKQVTLNLNKLKMQKHQILKLKKNFDNLYKIISSNPRNQDEINKINWIYLIYDLYESKLDFTKEEKNRDFFLNENFIKMEIELFRSINSIKIKKTVLEEIGFQIYMINDLSL